MGHQLPASHPPQERERVLVADPEGVQLTRVSLAGEMQRPARADFAWLDLQAQAVPASAACTQIQASRTDKVTDAIHDVGLDARYGVTAGLNLDVTINTDFAQVEVDEQQVNLTRFGLFYPEKRDFFLENSNFFTMGTGSAFTTTPGADRSVLQPPHRPVRYRHADADHRRRAPRRQDRRATTSAMLDIQTDQAFGRPGDELLRGPLQPRHLPAVARRRALHQQGHDRRASEHYNRTMGVDANLALSRNCRSTRSSPRPTTPDRGRRHGVLRPHRLPRSAAGTCG